MSEVGLLLHKICRSKERAELINICPLGYFLSNKRDKIKMCTMCIYICAYMYVCVHICIMCIYVSPIYSLFLSSLML